MQYKTVAMESTKNGKIIYQKRRKKAPLMYCRFMVSLGIIVVFSAHSSQLTVLLNEIGINPGEAKHDTIVLKFHCAVTRLPLRVCSFQKKCEPMLK